MVLKDSNYILTSFLQDREGEGLGPRVCGIVSVPRPQKIGVQPDAETERTATDHCYIEVGLFSSCREVTSPQHVSRVIAILARVKVLWGCQRSRVRRILLIGIGPLAVVILAANFWQTVGIFLRDPVVSFLLE